MAAIKDMVFEVADQAELHFTYLDLRDHYFEMTEQIQAILWGYTDLGETDEEG